MWLSTATTRFRQEWAVGSYDDGGVMRWIEPCADEETAWRMHDEGPDQTTVMHRVVSDWQPEADRVWRTVPMCQTCWHHEHPRRIRVQGPEDEIAHCYWCGETTASGIYVRARVTEGG